MRHFVPEMAVLQMVQPSGEGMIKWARFQKSRTKWTKKKKGGPGRESRSNGRSESFTNRGSTKGKGS